MPIQIGQILLENKIITQAQLEIALHEKSLSPGKYLGQILCDMGVPQVKIIKALYYNNKRKAMGKILTDLAVITPEQLDRALGEQKSLRTRLGVRKPIGSYLVELGFISTNDYMKALSIHFTMPIIPLENFQVITEFQKALGEKYTYYHKIIVIQNNPNVIKVALAEPDFFIIEELEKALPIGKEIFFHLASLSEIELAFERKYDLQMANSK